MSDQINEQISIIQKQLQAINQAQINSANNIKSLTTQISNSISYDDIPIGSNLAKDFKLYFGDLDIIEKNQNQFIFGNSIWGQSRIGGNSTS